MGTIIKRNGIEHLNLVKRGASTIDSASLTQGMLTDDTVKYSVRSNSKLDIKINDTIEVFGNTYRINTLPTFKKTSNTEYSYEIEAQGLMYDLLRCKFFNADGEGFKTTTDFPLIGNLEVFLVAIRNNMHRFSANWEIGNFASTETKMITFGDDTCLSALQKICQEFKTDFWVKTEGGKFKIHTGAFGSTLPIDFEYGKGKGLYNLSRKNVDSNGIVNRLYVNGGTDNIPAGYRAFSDALKFSDAGYIEDTALIAEMGLIEGSIDFPDIYPKRTGVVSAVGSSKFKFHDSSMDFDLNEKEADGSTKYLIAGTSAKVHFNTGNLAGYEFEIKKGGYNHSTKEFEIIPFTNQTGQKFPDEVAEAFQIGVGDEYVLLDIVMPETYITNAEAALLTKANEQFALLKTVKVSYDLEVDPYYIKNLATPISIGDYVRVIDTALGINKVIRVQAITRQFITASAPTPYNYKLTLADSYEISFASQMVLDITEVKNVISVTNLGNINLSQLGYKTTEELRNLVFDTDGYFDAENIKPFSIQTNMLTVGAQSQQLSCSVVFLVNNAGNPNQVETKAGALFSQTFNKTWTIAGSVQTIPDNNSRYVYAKCSKNGTSGTIYFTQAQIKFDEDVNDYYFLLGILHTVTEGVRVLSITIGTTTINGGLVRTGIISSLDGQTYFNLNTGELRGKFTFTDGTNVQTAVAGAQATANTALSGINDMTNDNKLTANEKQTTVVEWNRIKQEYTQNSSIANTLGISLTAYQNAYNTLNTYITPLLSNLTTTSTIDGTTFRNNFQNYYTQNVSLVQAIENKKIDNVQVGGRNLFRDSKFTQGFNTLEIVNANAAFQSGDKDGVTFPLKGNGLLIDSNSGDSYVYLTQIIPVEPNQSYVLTFYQNAAGGINANSSYFNYNDNAHIPIDFSITNSKTFTKKTIVFTTRNNSTSVRLRFGFQCSSYAWMTISGIKLEKGNKATDWTPAPEDIDSAISTANANSANALAQAQNALNTASAVQNITSFLQTSVQGNVVGTGTLLVGDVNGANAMISGVTDKPNGESIRFAAGKPYAQKYNSPFQVLDNGMVRFVNPLTGQKTFELGFNQNTGKVVFDIYNDNGIKVATIGSQGIMFTGYIPESFTAYELRKMNTGNFTTTDIINELNSSTFEKYKLEREGQYDNPPTPETSTGWVLWNVGIKTNQDAFLYYEGRNFESAGNAQYAGFHPTENKFDNPIPDGIYLNQSVSDFLMDPKTYTYLFTWSTEAWLIKDGKITASLVINKELDIRNINERKIPY